MYTIDGVNAAIIFQYEDEWDDLCRCENIPNPYDIIERNKRLMYKYTKDVMNGIPCTRVEVDNSIDEMDGVSEEMLEQYEEAKAKFMCQSILRDFSWEALAANLCYGRYAEKYLPCAGADGQCSMFCPRFGGDCSDYSSS